MDMRDHMVEDPLVAVLRVDQLEWNQDDALGWNFNLDVLENEGYLTVFSGHQASDTTVGSNGTLDVRSGGVLYGTTTLTDKGTLVGDVVTNEGNLYYLNNSAATFAGTLTGTGTLTQEVQITR